MCESDLVGDGAGIVVNSEDGQRDLGLGVERAVAMVIVALLQEGVVGGLTMSRTDALSLSWRNVNKQDQQVPTEPILAVCRSLKELQMFFRACTHAHVCAGLCVSACMCVTGIKINDVPSSQGRN